MEESNVNKNNGILSKNAILRRRLSMRIYVPAVNITSFGVNITSFLMSLQSENRACFAKKTECDECDGYSHFKVLIASAKGCVGIHVFLYKEHLYKELEGEKGSKNKELTRLK